MGSNSSSTAAAATSFSYPPGYSSNIQLENPVQGTSGWEREGMLHPALRGIRTPHTKLGQLTYSVRELRVERDETSETQASSSTRQTDLYRRGSPKRTQADRKKTGSEPKWATNNTNTHDVPWWCPNIDDKISDELRLFLELYSRISPEEVNEHVYGVREEAWAIRSYPCTGLGAFLRPTLPYSSAFAAILQGLSKGARLIDIGSFIGHDLRVIAGLGYPSWNLFALDIVSHWNIGYRMFRDLGRFKANFVEADILNPNAALRLLEGTMNIVTITHLLHQWNLEDQAKALKEVVRLINDQKYAMIVGLQIGTTRPRSTEEGPYLHSPETFRTLWNEVEIETGTEWRCDVSLQDFGRIGLDKPEYLGQDEWILSFSMDRTPVSRLEYNTTVTFPTIVNVYGTEGKAYVGA